MNNFIEALMAIHFVPKQLSHILDKSEELSPDQINELINEAGLSNDSISASKELYAYLIQRRERRASAVTI